MKRSLLIIIFLVSLGCCYPQKTTYKINYYSPREYGKGHEAKNLACVQDHNGVLYFGNAGGILQYDGVSWSFIPVKNQSMWIYALAISEDNVVYVGAQSEFGYLAPDEYGKLSYVSLSDQIPQNQRSFASIIRLWAWKNKVAFQFEEALFVYSNGKLNKIVPETSFHISFLVDSELYVRQRGVGIMRLTGDSLQLVRGSEYLRDFGVFAILQSSDPQKYIIITHEDGFWSVDKDSFRGSYIKTVDSTLYRQSEIFGGIRLTDGKIAINTGSNGIILTDETFKIITVINTESGLKVNGVISLLEDYQGNIWAGMDNGIVQVLYSSPVSFFGSESGISGNVNAIVRYNGNLFIGTTNGLFIQNNNYKTSSASFVQFGGLSKEVIDLCLTNNSLLIGTMDELYEIRNNDLKKLENIDIGALHYSEKLKMLFISRKKKFSVFEYSGILKKLKDIPEITEEVVRFEETILNKNVTLWMGTSLQGVVRLQILNSIDFKVDKYDSSDGLIENNWVLPFKIDNNVVFSQRDGLLTFIDEKTIRNQLPDSLKNRPKFYKGYFDAYRIDSTKSQIDQPIYLIEDTRDRIYVNLDGDLGYFDKTNSYTFMKQPFCLTDVGKINTFFHENNGICWIGGNDGLLKFNEHNSKNYTIDFNTLITKVSCGGKDSVLYWGNGEKITSQKKENLKRKIIIRYSLNTVTLTFAAPFFEGQERILYSSRLDRQDTAYSPWRIDNRIVFGNLREGDYTFKVRAMNVYGHLGSEKAFKFRVLAPWYRKLWAIVLYIFVIAGIVYIAIRLNSRRLVALNKKLEKTIQERTREIQEKNLELEKQKEEILASINYALRIQKAILPNEELLQNWLGDHFVLHRPKDIVSGDFYWIIVYNHYILFCVADCTGHGVPGAFMSMLCTSLLNEIVLRGKVLHPELILNRVRIMIIESLKQKGLMGEQKDGMDIALCIYDKETSKLEFSGANNPLYIVRKNDKEAVQCFKQLESKDYILYEIKGDSMPISIYEEMSPFKRHTINLLENDRIYLFSDGISDQFGGPDGKRFMKNSLRLALLETITPEIKNQKSLMEERIDKWQAYINPLTGQTYSQVDDICLMGVKF
jgi:serine phosphatase RsbU (regulator of sigma subunit)/ligand-binding sensor domain-containing protein